MDTTDYGTQGRREMGGMDMPPRMRRMSVDPRLMIGLAAGALLVGAVVMLLASPEGRRLRDRAAEGMGRAAHDGRQPVQDALQRSRKRLKELQSQAQHRRGDLKHQAKVLRARADVRKLEKRVSHIMG